MVKVYNMHDAKSNLSKLVEMVEAGHRVRIARNGKPVIELKVVENRSRPKFGEFEPLAISLPEDFDEPVPEWEEAIALSLSEIQTSRQN